MSNLLWTSLQRAYRFLSARAGQLTSISILASRKQKQARCRPCLEALEDRVTPSATLVHLYDLNGSLADGLGGPNLQADGGTLTATSYTFNANQGLRLLNGLTDPADYSIVLNANLISIGSHYKKIIDFQARSSDAGLYVAGTQLQLYPAPAGSGVVPLGADCQITLTRSAATGLTSIYLNGVLARAYVGNVAVPLNNVLTFFEDDLVSRGREAVAGSVDYIAIYHGSLTADEVAGLVNQPPSAPPGVSADQASVTVSEGQTAFNTGTWTNAVSMSASLGNVTQSAGGVWSWSFAASDGPYQTPVTITAIGPAGTTATTTFQLTVNNALPVIALSGNASVDEGSTYALNLSVSNAGADTIQSWTITWGDGAVEQLAGSLAAATHVYANGPGDYTISASATVDDGAVVAAGNTVDVHVNNHAPVITSLVSSNPTELLKSPDGLVTVTGTFVDPGILDTHTVRVSWGDGTSTTLASGVLTNGRFSASHQYNQGGIFTVTVTVWDDDDGWADSSVSAVVTGVGQVGDVLYVIGSDANDVIHIDQFRGRLPGEPANVAPHLVLRVTTHLALGSATHRTVAYFDSAAIQRIVVLAGGGNDQVTLADNVLMDAIFVGETGNDHLRGGRGNALLSGGPGNDHLHGHAGADLLVGGGGKDQLKGGKGDNLLLQESLPDQEDLDVLESALAEWLNPSTLLAA